MQSNDTLRRAAPPARRRPQPGHWAWACIALLASTAQAQQARDDNDRYLTGDWGGARTRLEDRGINLGATYFAEGAGNFRGGSRHDVAYAAELSVYGSFDLQKLWGWSGGTLRVKFTNRNGENLNDTAQLHELMQSQPIYGRGNITRISQFYLQQKLDDDRLTIKLGRLTVGDEFDDYPCNFMLLSMCGSQPGNMLGSIIYNNPVSQWAGTLRYDFSPSLYASLGVYQVDPAYLRTSQGLNFLSPSGTIGVLVPAEVGWKWHPGGLPGTYKLGGWYDNAGGDDLFENQDRRPLLLDGGRARHRGHDHGFYFSAVQRVLPRGGDPARGLDVEFHAVHANARITRVDRLVTLGLVYHGPFDSRPRDMFGVGTAWLHVSNELARGERIYNATLPPDAEPLVVQNAERSFLMFYHVQLLGSVYLSPELQYIRHPSGNRDYHDDLVLGLRTVLDF